MPTSTAATTIARLLAGGEAADLDRNAQRAVRPHQVRQLHVERERARGAVDREPLHADGAARHALRLRIERPAQRRDHVGAGAPILADRHRDLRGAGLHVGGRGGDQPVADDVERHLAGRARRHGDIHGVARLVLLLVERDLEHVGRVGARLGVPAGVERDRSHRTVRIVGRHFEAIAAPGDRRGNARGLVGRDIDLAVGDAPRRLHRLVVPGAVLLVILVLALDLEQLPAQAGPRDRLAVGRHHDHVEGRGLALAERTAGEQRLDADHVRRRASPAARACAPPRGRRPPPCAR